MNDFDFLKLLVNKNAQNNESELNLRGHDIIKQVSAECKSIIGNIDINYYLKDKNFWKAMSIVIASSKIINDIDKR